MSNTATLAQSGLHGKATPLLNYKLTETKSFSARRHWHHRHPLFHKMKFDVWHPTLIARSLTDVL